MRAHGPHKKLPAALGFGLLGLLLLQHCACRSITGPSPAQAPEVLIAALDPPCYDSDVEEFEQRLNNTMASMMTQLAALQAAQQRTAYIMQRAGEVIEQTALLPGAKPFNCSCEDFHAALCFGAGCYPCPKSCFKGNMSYMATIPGAFDSGLWCVRGKPCMPCCNDVVAVPNTTCALPVGGCT